MNRTHTAKKNKVRTSPESPSINDRLPATEGIWNFNRMQGNKHYWAWCDDSGDGIDLKSAYSFVCWRRDKVSSHVIIYAWILDTSLS